MPIGPNNLTRNGAVIDRPSLVRNECSLDQQIRDWIGLSSQFGKEVKDAMLIQGAGTKACKDAVRLVPRRFGSELGPSVNMTVINYDKLIRKILTLNVRYIGPFRNQGRREAQIESQSSKDMVEGRYWNETNRLLGFLMRVLILASKQNHLTGRRRATPICWGRPCVEKQEKERKFFSLDSVKVHVWMVSGTSYMCVTHKP